MIINHDFNSLIPPLCFEREFKDGRPTWFCLNSNNCEKLGCKYNKMELLTNIMELLK